jgi:hypothetical protein
MEEQADRTRHSHAALHLQQRSPSVDRVLPVGPHDCAVPGTAGGRPEQLLAAKARTNATLCARRFTSSTLQPASSQALASTCLPSRRFAHQARWRAADAGSEAPIAVSTSAKLSVTRSPGCRRRCSPNGSYLPNGHTSLLPCAGSLRCRHCGSGATHRELTHGACAAAWRLPQTHAVPPGENHSFSR